MSDPISPDSTPATRSFGRKLIIGLGVLALLLVVFYFVLSSSAFFKAVILPQVAKALNAEVTVANASIQPFSQVTLEKVLVRTTGSEPLLTAEQVRARYSLLSILRGHYQLNELTVLQPVVQVITEADGKSNLDPIMRPDEAARQPSPPSSEPLRLSLRDVRLQQATVRSVQKQTDGAVATTELNNLNLTVDRAGNGETGKLALNGNLILDHRVPPATGGTNDLLESKLDGEFAFKLDQQLLPETLTGSAKAALGRVEGAYADFAGLSGTFQADVTPTQVRQLVLQFARAGQNLGRVQASGPLDLNKKEGRLRLEVQAIDRQILNLAGASRGWDFGASTLNATNLIDLSRQGEVIGAKGQVVGRQISITEAGRSTPVLDLDLEYDMVVSPKDQSAVIRTLTVVGQQDQRELLRAALDRPMNLTWASSARGVAESRFQLTLSQFDLNQWRPVLGTNLPAGKVDLQLTVDAKRDGKDLAAVARAVVQDFATTVGTNRIDQVRLALKAEGRLQNFDSLNLRQVELEATRANQLLFRSSGSGHYDRNVKDLTGQVSAEAALPAVLRQVPLPDVQASDGVLRLTAAVTHKTDRYAVTGNVALQGFTGQYATYQFKDYQTTLDYNVDLVGQVVQIHNASVTFRQGYNAGGSLAVQGDYDRDKGSAQVSYRLLDLNQHALEPLFSPAIAPKKLISISLSGDGAATYNPAGETAVKTDLKVANWVVAAPGQTAPPKLDGQFQIDAGLRQDVVDLRNLLVKLSPTPRAHNQIQAKARLDLSATNPTPSQLTVTSDALDLTHYYEMFTGNAAAGQGPAAQPVPAPAPPASTPPVEPAPAELPVQQLTADLKVGRLYIRDVAITNLVTTARVNQGQLNLKPIELTVNGAPVSAQALLNLGVPGYIYDFSFKCDGVPVEPLANTFTTNAPGTYKGQLTASGEVKGAGLTGPSLQKNLNGRLTLSLTNMQYEIVGPKARRLLEPIALILRVPELTQTPLNWIESKAGIAKGQINLQEFTVQSPAFFAETKGVIPMAEVLTNSPLNLPVALSLRRTLAEKANLVSASPNTATNTYYAALPTFVTLSGTLGEPKTEINKLVIGGLLAKSIGGIAPVGDKASTILQGVGGLLTGQSTGAAATNAPAATNASPAASIVQGLGKLLDQSGKQQAATNAAPATNKPARINPLDLLKLIPEKK